MFSQTCPMRLSLKVHFTRHDVFGLADWTPLLDIAATLVDMQDELHKTRLAFGIHRGQRGGCCSTLTWTRREECSYSSCSALVNITEGFRGASVKRLSIYDRKSSLRECSAAPSHHCGSGAASPTLAAWHRKASFPLSQCICSTARVCLVQVILVSCCLRV